MCTARPRRGSVLLLAAALLLVTLPAAAQPAASTSGSVGETGLAHSWLQAASAWLAGFLPGSDRGLAFTTERGPDGDPLAATSLEPQRGSEADPAGEPTVEPQRGPESDPAG